MIKAVIFGTWFVGSLVLPSSPLESGETALQGAELAEEFCVHCHEIGREGENKSYPPSFVSIARFRAREQIWSRIMFPALHPAGMPPMFRVLLPEEVDKIVDYILSLE